MQKAHGIWALTWAICEKLAYILKSYFPREINKQFLEVNFVSKF